MRSVRLPFAGSPLNAVKSARQVEDNRPAKTQESKSSHTSTAVREAAAV
jgi:hypothetical protein